MSSDIIEVRVPDVGDVDEVEVVEVLVDAGEEVEAEDSLVTLESDKASMDLPAPEAGRIAEINVKVGDMVGEGSLIATIEKVVEKEEEEEKEEQKEGGEEGAEATEEAEAREEVEGEERQRAEREEQTEEPESRGETEERKEAETEEEDERGERRRRRVPRPVEPPPKEAEEPPPTPEAISPPTEPEAEAESPAELPYASPSLRRFARELGVDLRRVRGSGRKGRIVEEDVKAFVKEAVAEPPGAEAVEPGEAIPAVPGIDFSKFGKVEEVTLSRIQRRSKENVYRSWLNVPHVTQHDTADVTEMEAFRKEHAAGAEERGFKLTPVAFVMKATVAALEEFPRLNSSLGPAGETLILKKYYHLGIAVDTEEGLVVPVIRDVDRKGIFELAEELGEVSERARQGKLEMRDFQGASFTISSLGGIGGTAFTPIVNAPEVAILGLSRHRREPVWRDGEFVPRLLLPLSLSYDHRVVDGAEAVRFTSHLAELLGDIRRLLL